MQRSPHQLGPGSFLNKVEKLESLVYACLEQGGIVLGQGRAAHGQGKGEAGGLFLYSAPQLGSGPVPSPGLEQPGPGRGAQAQLGFGAQSSCARKGRGAGSTQPWIPHPPAVRSAGPARIPHLFNAERMLLESPRPSTDLQAGAEPFLHPEGSGAERRGALARPGSSGSRRAALQAGDSPGGAGREGCRPGPWVAQPAVLHTAPTHDSARDTHQLQQSVQGALRPRASLSAPPAPPYPRPHRLGEGAGGARGLGSAARPHPRAL